MSRTVIERHGWQRLAIKVVVKASREDGSITNFEKTIDLLAMAKTTIIRLLSNKLPRKEERVMVDGMTRKLLN